MMKPVGQLFLALVLSASLLGISRPAFAQKPERTTIQNVEPGSVCFPDNVCVPVGSAYGALREGPDPRSEWVTEVRDANGRAIGKVRPGGEILVLSPQAYARREAGQTTFTIERMDRSVRPVRTNYTRIASTLRRIGFDNWTSQGTAAIGMTATPPRASPITRDAWSVGGTIGAISPGGEVLGSVNDALVVFLYGDYWVVLHSDGLQFTITDARFATLASRITNLKAIYAPYDEYGVWKKGSDGRPVLNDTRRFASNPENRSVTFAYQTGQAGNGQSLYQVLPRRAGETSPPDLLGLFPLSQDFMLACGDNIRKVCMSGVPGWGAVWSTPDGPQISVTNLQATQFDSRRYKSLRWKSVGLYRGGIGEELDGRFRYLTTVVENDLSITFVHSQERYRAASEVESLITSAGLQQGARINAALEEERALERARYAAYQAQREADERERQARAALESSEFAKAQALLASNDMNAICAGMFTIKSVHGRNNLGEACTRLRGGPQVVSRGFWGDLAAGLAAYNAGAYGRFSAPSSSSSPASASGNNSGDFNRSMQTLDRNIRAIGDPNWNGSAAAAQRY
jgi:hypothetical protein